MSAPALVSYYLPANAVYPPLYIANPGLATNYLPCKDGLPANIGVYLNNLGPVTTAPIGFPGVKVGANSSVPTGTQGCVFDFMQYGIYATEANFQSQGNVFMSMQSYTVSSGYAGGDGIFAFHKQGGIGLTDNYRMLVGNTNPSGNWFYECRDGIECSGYTNVNIQLAKMWSDHSSAMPTQAYTDGYTGINIGGTGTNLVYNTISMNYNTISNYLFGINFTSSSDNTTGVLTIDKDTIVGQPITYWPTGYDSVAIIATNLLSGTTRGSVGSIAISDNELINVVNGILVNGYGLQPVTTAGNDVLLIAPSVPSLTAWQYGISHTNCKNNNITSNYITGDNGLHAILNNSTAIYGGNNTTALM